jgi:hypothetical protein
MEPYNNYLCTYDLYGVCFWCGQYPLLGQAGWSWALEIESFLGPVKWHRANIGECHLGLKKLVLP